MFLRFFLKKICNEFLFCIWVPFSLRHSIKKYAGKVVHYAFRIKPSPKLKSISRGVTKSFPRPGFPVEFIWFKILSLEVGIWVPSIILRKRQQLGWHYTSYNLLSPLLKWVQRKRRECSDFLMRNCGWRTLKKKNFGARGRKWRKTGIFYAE